ncbi:MAG: hypothetical protein EOO73_29680 [Myxococcales bacterium]|nr:MAG: hypothetical protein EOO73_29680 [Myxococcales bacterium]
MTIRTIQDLAVSRHRGAATGITFTLASPAATLFLGHITITPDATQATTVGAIRGGNEAEPGSVELRAPQAAFDGLLALASQPQTVKLVVSLTYDEATMLVSSILCRLAVAKAS